jgi:carbamoyl-phosphate synthase small subunit
LKATLTLSDGSWLEGKLIGAPLLSSGELVFTTAMVGYNETLTDPSFFGQIIVFSYPLIGNYGVPPLSGFDPNPGLESNKVHASAVIMTQDSETAYHWNTHTTIDQWLKEHNVPGLIGVDTRELIHKIRDKKQLLGIINPEESKGQRILHEKLKDFNHRDFFDPGTYRVTELVSTQESKIIGQGKLKVGIIDCGVKWNIIRNLLRLNCQIELVPWNADFTKIDCSAWVISNGPGDPANTGDLKERVAKLFKENRPMLGICMGNQIMGLSAGAKTERLVHGHRGHNQPVCLFGTNKAYMTSQNHSYVVSKDSLTEDWRPWFINVNDGSIEGIEHSEKPFRAVQFHPEAAGGPCDTQWIFDDFVKSIELNKN